MNTSMGIKKKNDIYAKHQSKTFVWSQQKKREVGYGDSEDRKYGKNPKYTMCYILDLQQFSRTKSSKCMWRPKQ